MSVIKEIKALGFPWETQDPFLFCAYHRDEYPRGNAQFGPAESLSGRMIGQDFSIKDGWRMYHGSTVPGFPYHPHRGFETITINKEGVVDHSDSLGAKGRFMAGDVQWMTAGKGVQHSEMFPLIHQDKDNPLEIFQIWLNLPKRSKFVEPHFKMLWKEKVPRITEIDKDGKEIKIELMAGEYKTVVAPEATPDSWASDKQNEVRIMTIHLEPKAKWNFKTGVETNSSLYFYKGASLKLGKDRVENHSVIHLENNKEVKVENGDEISFLLFLEGKPIGEPVAQYGPFVMNTQEEIQQAFEDYRRTEFGGWPWGEKEVSHGAEEGRFALHGDGREERP